MVESNILMYWTCGQCIMWVVGSKIVIGLYILTCSVVCTMCVGHSDTTVSVVCFRMCMVESNIVIGLYILDMWSVLCVMYVYGGGIG